jgi:hypothetical protein
MAIRTIRMRIRAFFKIFLSSSGNKIRVFRGQVFRGHPLKGCPSRAKTFPEHEIVIFMLCCI